MISAFSDQPTDKLAKQLPKPSRSSNYNMVIDSSEATMVTPQAISNLSMAATSVQSVSFGKHLPQVSRQVAESP